MRRAQIVAVAAMTGLVLAGATVPALGGVVSDQPPVVVDDAVTLLTGGSTTVDVLSDDSDDQDQLALCRVRGGSSAEATIVAGRVYVNVPTSEPGDYAVHYQACDYDYLSLGTLTVHVVAPRAVTVHKVVDQPGVLRATNPNPVPVLLLWAKPKGNRIDGHMRVPAGSSKTFTVTRHHIVWAALDPSSHWEDGSLVGYGQVRRIPLPATPTPAAAPSGPRLTRWWLASRSGTATRSRVSDPNPSVTWPADPTTVLPPTPQADTVHWWSGAWGRVPVTDNDTDPQGQPLDVCRLGPDAIAPPVTSNLSVDVVEGRLYLGARRHASGTVLVPYYVCNSGRLAPTVLRVELRQADPLVVHPVAGAPAQVRVRNHNVVPVLFVVGISPGGGEILGRVGDHAARTFHLPRAAHFWEGMIGRSGGYAGSGRLPGR